MGKEPRVLLTRLIPAPAIDLLRKYFELEINTLDRKLTKDELVKKIPDKDGLLCLLVDQIDREVFKAAQKLKIVANYAAGYDNIDVAEATRRKIAVTNTPDVLTETTADLTFALLLASARKIVEADEFLRAGQFSGWSPMLFLGEDVYSKTLGIIGLGKIGRAVARRANGFNMRIIYYEPERLAEEIESEYQVIYRELDDLFAESDFIAIHTPLTDSTRHLISEREFSLMKNNAFLINAARGPIVNEQALVEALKKGRIAGCGLDVYEKEPAVTAELTKMKNAVLLPHLGSASLATRTKMGTMAAENLIARLVKETKPLHLINQEVLDENTCRS